jgi:hypothetical protein
MVSRNGARGIADWNEKALIPSILAWASTLLFYLAQGNTRAVLTSNLLTMGMRSRLLGTRAVQIGKKQCHSWKRKGLRRRDTNSAIGFSKAMASLIRGHIMIRRTLCAN